jgi:aldehyde dehydrogenase (NAD+)
MTFEYAPAPESRAIVDIKAKYGHFIDGKFLPGKKHFATINPATEEVLSQISLGGASDVDKAVAAAQKAYTKTWSKLSGKERAHYLRATFVALFYSTNCINYI